jgi:molybdenum cofactor biosynthesis enzyme MoaA
MICHHCKQANEADARFCEHCGRPRLPHHVSVQPAVLDGPIDLSAITLLRDEKQRLSRRLQDLLARAEGRPFTEEEEGTWQRLYGAWKSVSDELTARMDYVTVRESQDRRRGERRERQRRGRHAGFEAGERRAGADRRGEDRRSGVDRRTPFPETPAGGGTP